MEFISYDSVSQDSPHHFFLSNNYFFSQQVLFSAVTFIFIMTPPLYETPAPPSSSIQVTFAFFVGISENRIARLPRYPDSPNMALALHAARRPTLLFELRISRLSPSVTEFLISGILRGSTPTQDWWEYWDTERSEQSVSSPFNVLVHSHAHPYIWGAIVRALF